jgi:hypothetical protein
MTDPITVEDIRQRMAGTQDDLAGILSQLAAAQEFLAARRPPVSKYGPTTIWQFCTSPAEVDAIAARIGVKAAWDGERERYAAVKPFGRNVSYRAVYIVKVAGLPDDTPVPRDSTRILAAVA